jgi:hypothetical protein
MCRFVCTFKLGIKSLEKLTWNNIDKQVVEDVIGIVVTYEIRVFFEGAQKEVFSSILKFENVNT